MGSSSMRCGGFCTGYLERGLTKRGCDGPREVRSPIHSVEDKSKVYVASVDGATIVEDFKGKKFQKIGKELQGRRMIDLEEKLVNIGDEGGVHRANSSTSKESRAQIHGRNYSRAQNWRVGTF